MYSERACTDRSEYGVQGTGYGLEHIVDTRRRQLESRRHMANIKSQKKRNRQNEVQRQRNKSIKSDLKTSVKKVEQAAAAGEPTDALYRDAQKKLDKAASKGVLHPKTAARKKSRLT